MENTQSSDVQWSFTKKLMQQLADLENELDAELFSQDAPHAETEIASQRNTKRRSIKGEESELPTTEQN